MASGILKIQRNNPAQVARDKVRTFRRARRKGWAVVEVGTADGRFWSDVVKEIQASSIGKVVPWYNPTNGQKGLLGAFAFEEPADATWVQLKFG